uniref:THH1/TOM1/TOM3 domain-containing protein n=1 Tax=Phaeomonas parva TaxID=124430 RepID=A0A7S1XQN0_9STRA|mmetsp:Transcript_25736/g.80594  ORF Transcript_25736/g.80594 Transcript_25736/m.80594 type:complete len:364 (+) Transcript_25736:115-1206(+)
MPSLLRGDQTATFAILSFLYASMTVYTFSRLKMLHAITGQALDTQKLFVVTLLLTCVLRTLSFVGLTSLAVQSIEYGGDDNDDTGERDEDEEFYEKAVLVMFDLPDYTIVTAYLLLVIVYAETFLHARRHWLDPIQMRRRWVVWYLGANSVLYGVQITLYTLLFVPRVPQSLLIQLLFITLGAISFCLPIAVAIGYFYLTYRFSAFPYRSQHAAKRVKKVGLVMKVWTVGRFIWGCFAVFFSLSFVSTSNDTAYSTVLICLFVCTELIPFLLALDTEILNVLAILSSNSRELRVDSVDSTTTGGPLSGATNRNVDFDFEEPLLSPDDEEFASSIGLEDIANSMGIAESSSDLAAGLGASETKS